MSPRSLVLIGCGLVAVMGCLALALMTHSDTESSANPPPAPASSVTPLDALARAIGTPGAETPTGRLVAKMSLERQVAQLFFVGFDGFDTAPATKREWGAILVRPSNTTDAAQVKRLTYLLGTPSKKGRVPALVTAAEPATGAGFPSAQTRKQPVLARGG